MASGESVRRKLKFPKPTDAAKWCSDLEGLENQLDNDAETGQGKLSERPVAGIRGRLYMIQGDTTTANNGILWWDTGSTWLAIQDRVGEEQVYSTPVSATENVFYEPSTIRSALVRVTGEITGNDRTGFRIIVAAGAKLETVWSRQTVGATGKVTILTGVFILSLGQKWRWENIGRLPVEGVTSSFVLL